MLNWYWKRLFLTLVALSGLVPATYAQNDRDEDVVGTVYTMTNAAGPNSVVVYHRLSDGTLQPASTVPTGGRGTGTGLGRCDPAGSERKIPLRNARRHGEPPVVQRRQLAAQELLGLRARADAR
jgi:hypothetical protein